MSTAWTTDRLPANGTIYAFLTATAVEWSDSGDSDDYTEEHGWVSPRWSMTDLYESRNDVAPIDDWRLATDNTPDLLRPDPDQTPTDWLAALLNETLGSWSDNGDGTYYGHDNLITDYTDPRDYTYAVHVHVKHCDSTRGWVEDSVTLADRPTERTDQ
jgi:hypothetical protein